jgi:hypothetical protein
MLNQSLSIDDVETQFIKWRKNKSRADAKIPAELWIQVKILLKSNRYSTGIITRRLRLTTQQLKDNKLLPRVITNKATTNSFVSLSIPPNTIKSIDQSQGSDLTIMHGDAKCIITNPTVEQFQLIISKILG